jgi:hypothetical protein
MVAEVRHLWDPQVGNFSENLDTFFRNDFVQAMDPSHPNQKTNTPTETFPAPVSAHPNLTEEQEHQNPKVSLRTQKGKKNTQNPHVQFSRALHQTLQVQVPVSAW